MNKTNLLILGLLVLVVLLGIAIYKQQTIIKEEPLETSSPAPVQEATETVKQPIVHYRVPEPTEPSATETEPTEKPAEQPQLNMAEEVPSMAKSDERLEAYLVKIISDSKLLHLLKLEDFIQRFVATVDSLPEKKLSQKILPIQAPEGRFIVSGTDEQPQTSSRNQKRYASYVKLLESLPEDQLIKIYVHFYPLFQSAYQQLGYPSAYFNDRLVHVLDHLLATPDVNEPILLKQPSVLYTYADPQLENRSAGQKLLIRIGSENRKRVKTVLAAYRNKLVNLTP